ncbi:MAG: OmpA family protein [bacterium]|nr:OmpA family protein [bacterium]
MMRKFVSPALAVLLIAGLSLTGCATKTYVDEAVQASEQRDAAKIGEVQTSVEGNQAEISKLHKKDAALEADIKKLSAAAKDALKRAEEAGKLAKGKFVYEITLTDDNVNFGFDKYKVSDEAKAALDGFAAKVKSENKNVYVEIQGHTDNIGTEKYNMKLGYQRAERVMHYLNADHGFALHRMNVISFGELKPVADNKDRAGRSQNRRVTLVVLE